MHDCTMTDLVAVTEVAINFSIIVDVIVVKTVVVSRKTELQKLVI